MCCELYNNLAWSFLLFLERELRDALTYFLESRKELINVYNTSK